ncbi:hypothetical protein EFL14_RS09455 [Enterococcus hirae]|uniref:HEPN domain-containing protein n=1 Tax=Enterococcus sp. C63 TaxID=3231324 RepID=UPI001A057A01|nr:hypothetical protein [Enterococcus hirae]EMF0448857.1 hypothetical protein [Enterococcus hirae]EMF0516924.1 hypothetical protein [Enterococcus hirae]EMF0518402.1 hypothetical protein [Enterococcus hirae]
MDIESEFSNYRTEKREEIQTMALIIQSLPEEFTDREKDLLLRSFIVLTYAYWESCYHKVQNVVFEKYNDALIKNLPFALKNKIYLELAKEKAGSFKTKLLREIDNYQVFKNITEGIGDNENKPLSEHNNKLMKKGILDNRGNPTFDDLTKFMKNFNVSLDKVVDKNVSDGLIVPYFLDFLSFIIIQRNAIAHKNEKIQYKDRFFNTYFKCIEVVTKDYSIEYGETITYDSADLVKEMLFQIDRLFTILIETVEEKRREMEKNDNNN